MNRVADTIERFLEGRDKQWDWDDFVGVPITDPELEAVRPRSVGLTDEFPASGKYCSEEGFAVMRDLVAKLRVRQAARRTVPTPNEGELLGRG